MEILKKLLQQVYYYIQLLILLFYIVLEELIWEEFAKPIYEFILKLRIATAFENFLKRQNRYVPLVFFLSTFVFGELLGLMTPFILAEGLVIVAVLIYMTKILIVAFAFWLFKIEKERLLSFTFFRLAYDKIVYISEKVKATKLYQKLVKQLKEIKTYLKVKIRYIKDKIFK